MNYWSINYTIICIADKSVVGTYDFIVESQGLPDTFLISNTIPSPIAPYHQAEGGIPELIENFDPLMLTRDPDISTNNMRVWKVDLDYND